MIGEVCWDICFFLELGEGMESYNIQNGGQVVSQRKIRVLLSEERKGILGRQKSDTCPSHSPCPFILLLAFEVYEKMDHFTISIL